MNLPSKRMIGKPIFDIKYAKIFLVKHCSTSARSRYMVITSYRPFTYYHLDKCLKITNAHRYYTNYQDFSRNYEDNTTAYEMNTEECKQLLTSLVMEAL